MDLLERISLVNREPTEEIITNNELSTLLQSVSTPRHYIGLEISGELHLGSLVLTGFKINDLIKAKFHTIIFLADWHTYINNKLDSDWEKIKMISHYYTDAFKFFCPGVNIILGSDLYSSSDDYWKNFMEFSKHMTLARTLRSLTIMGRNEKDHLDFSQFLYPAMQASDIHELELDLVHAGTDQRKIHMLVREIFPKLHWKVPVCLHHHLLPGLVEPVTLGITEDNSEDLRISSKMSKSKPMEGIFIHDDNKTIENKIKKSFCPEGIVKNNPILEIIRYVVFHEYTDFTIERSAKYGGNISYNSYTQLEKDYADKLVHPADLKQATTLYLCKLIEPIRNHFKGREPSF